MPTYDFRCRVCGHQWEATIKMADPNPKCERPTEAPEPCNGESEKVFCRAAPVHFHGKCWAKDGYK